MEDAKNNTINACEDWLSRINSDILYVSEVVAIQRSKVNNSTLHLRKKNEFDVNRAKAILKADQRALRKAFPNYLNYKNEMTNSGKLSPLKNGSSGSIRDTTSTTDDDEVPVYRSVETEQIFERISEQRKYERKSEYGNITSVTASGSGSGTKTEENEVSVATVENLLKEFLG